MKLTISTMNNTNNKNVVRSKMLKKHCNDTMPKTNHTNILNATDCRCQCLLTKCLLI